MRKTIAVDDVRVIANRMLADSIDDVREGRIAVTVMLERVLHDTGNYRGFQYLPGVVSHDVSPPEVIGDETRRRYF